MLETDVRYVTFPAERAIGVLQLRDFGVSGGWHWLCEAKGRVAVPLGKELRLNIPADAVGDLSPLDALELDDISWLDMGKTPLQNAQLIHLANLMLLRRLDLGETPIDDFAMKHIAKLTALKELRLHRTQITDAGLAPLVGLAALENLWLYDTALTDAAAEHLCKMASLQMLQLPKTLSHTAVVRLKTALPECYINLR